MKILLKSFIILGGLFLIAAMLILRPVPIVQEDRALEVEGLVKTIYEGGENDVVFLLEDNQTRYYINRGLEMGLNLESLQKELIGQEVLIKYPKYWTPLDWNDEIKHLSKLVYGDSVYFNELLPL